MSYTESCDGARYRFTWMDDSYSHGASAGPCPALSGERCLVPSCPSNNKPKEDPVPNKDTNVTIKVSIPVTLGGYTGQRDQWEEGTSDMTLSVKDGQVTFQSGGSVQTKIVFSAADFDAALRMLGAALRADVTGQ